MDFSFVTQPATFQARPNRFRVVARLALTDALIDAHCADPGRLSELLIPGATIHVSRAENLQRKTAYDLRFVEHPAHGQLISLDSRLPNQLVWHELHTGKLAHFTGFAEVKREVSAPSHDGNGIRSRFDFHMIDRDGRDCWIEVKSATLVEEEGIARFPDAPTARGCRHLRELSALATRGDRTAVVFIIQRPDATSLEPNWKTDPEFGSALLEAKTAGVELYAFTCLLNTHAISIACEVPINLTIPTLR